VECRWSSDVVLDVTACVIQIQGAILTLATRLLEEKGWTSLH
jgi:hypothetical protein